MPSAVADYLSAEQFVAWMAEHGWSVNGLVATGFAGSRRTISRLRNGHQPLTPALTLALPMINKRIPRGKRA